MGFEIKNKVALVTGGASGIGYSIVKQLLQNGAKGVTIADINVDLGEKVEKELNNKYGKNKVIFVNTDVTSTESFENAFKATVDKFNYIDILFNNAGIVNEVNWKKCMEVNLGGVITGTYLATEKYFKTYKSGEEGVIINTASLLGVTPLEINLAYVATKYGVVGFTKCYAFPHNYERFKVRVIAICPSLTKSAIVISDSIEEYLRSEEDRQMINGFLQALATKGQSADHVAEETMKLIQNASSGSIWVIAESKPAYQFISEDIKLV